MGLLRYRIDTNSIQGQLADYLNNSEEFKIVDNDVDYQEIESSTTTSSTTKTVPTTDDEVIKAKTNENSECCHRCNDDLNNDKMIEIDDNKSKRLTIRQFTKKYTALYSSYRFDNKRSPNIAPFGKISPIKSNLAKFDNKDIITNTTKNIEDEKISKTIPKLEQLDSLPPLSSSSAEQSSSLIPCNHCSYQGKSENEVLVHSVNSHPGLPARPDPSLLGLLQQQKKDTNKNEEDDDEVKE